MEEVLAQAGATLPVRDQVDERVITDVINGTGDWIDSPEELAAGRYLMPERRLKIRITMVCRMSGRTTMASIPLTCRPATATAMAMDIQMSRNT